MRIYIDGEKIIGYKPYQIRHKTQESDKVMSQGITDITVSNCRDLQREKTKINSHQVNSQMVVAGGHKFVNALLEVLS